MFTLILLLAFSLLGAWVGGLTGEGVNVRYNKADAPLLGMVIGAIIGFALYFFVF